MCHLPVFWWQRGTALLNPKTSIAASETYVGLSAMDVWCISRMTRFAAENSKILLYSYTLSMDSFLLRRHSIIGGPTICDIVFDCPASLNFSEHAVIRPAKSRKDILWFFAQWTIRRYPPHLWNTFDHRLSAALLYTPTCQSQTEFPLKIFGGTFTGSAGLVIDPKLKRTQFGFKNCGCSGCITWKLTWPFELRLK